MTRVGLLDRDHGPEAAGRLGQHAHVLDAGDAHLLELGPQRRRARERQQHVDVGHRPPLAGGPQDRLVAVQDLLDLQHRLGDRMVQLVGVVAGVLGERSLGEEVVRVDLALEDDLGAGRHRQPGQRRHQVLGLLAAHGAGDVEVVRTLVHQRAGHEQQRVAADDRRGRHLLAQLGPLLHDPLAALAGQDLHAAALAVEHLHAVGAEVGLVGLRVAQHDEDRGADIAPAVEREEARHREHVEVDLVAGQHVGEYRAVLDLARLDQALGGDALLHPRLRRFAQRVAVRQPEHDRQPLGGREGAGEDRRVVAAHVLEQQRRALALLDELGDVRDFQVPVDRGADALEFAGGVALADVAAQIHGGDVLGGEGFG